ncbi:MAG: hypothetical protein E5Y07_31880 [Mesorhizobium sp.]|nr:MAG: hypothetical protein E5Y07_31880 [Mesorhizobium sp.]
MIAAIKKRNTLAVQNAKLAHHRFEARAIARRRDHDIGTNQIAVSQDHAARGKFPHLRKNDDLAGLHGFNRTVIGGDRGVLRDQPAYPSGRSRGQPDFGQVPERQTLGGSHCCVSGLGRQPGDQRREEMDCNPEHALGKQGGAIPCGKPDMRCVDFGQMVEDIEARVSCAND